MKKAVIFDVDGTLLDTERIYMEAWQQGGALLGYPVPWETLLKTRAVSAEVAIPIYRAGCGEDFPFEAVRDEKNRISEEIIATKTPEQLWKPGAIEVLTLLRERGIPVAAATATRMSLTRAHLARAGLLEYLPVIVTGDMVAHSKPAPDIFLLAAERLGCRPEECAVVGDTPADVFGGYAAGMDVYLIPDQVPANPDTVARSRRVLENLGQLMEALEEDA